MSNISLSEHNAVVSDVCHMIIDINYGTPSPRLCMTRQLPSILRRFNDNRNNNNED